MRSALYTGTLVHARRTPSSHVFRYPVCMYALDLDEGLGVRGRDAFPQCGRQGLHVGHGEELSVEALPQLVQPVGGFSLERRRKLVAREIVDGGHRAAPTSPTKASSEWCDVKPRSEYTFIAATLSASTYNMAVVAPAAAR